MVEQAGRIWVVHSENGTEISEFLDIRSIVDFDGEKGLLNMAFHPNYSTNGLFYLVSIHQKTPEIPLTSISFTLAENQFVQLLVHKQVIVLLEDVIMDFVLEKIV